MRTMKTGKAAGARISHFKEHVPGENMLAVRKKERAQGCLSEKGAKKSGEGCSFPAG